MEATHVSSFQGSGALANRSATIYRDDEGYFVEVYNNGEAVRQIDVRDHSIVYANDTADNWVSGLIKE